MYLVTLMKFNIKYVLTISLSVYNYGNESGLMVLSEMATFMSTYSNNIFEIKVVKHGIK